MYKSTAQPNLLKEHISPTSQDDKGNKARKHNKAYKIFRHENVQDGVELMLLI